MFGLSWGQFSCCPRPEFTGITGYVDYGVRMKMAEHTSRLSHVLQRSGHHNIPEDISTNGVKSTKVLVSQM